MHIYIYSPEFAERTLLTRLKRNKNSSLSGMFSAIRRRNDCEVIGDIPLLGFCLTVFDKAKIRLTLTKVSYALAKLNDYQELTKREKMELAKYLETLIYLPSKGQILTSIKRNPKLLDVNRISQKL